MRQPWPKGDTYQITVDDYRGRLFVKPQHLRMVLQFSRVARASA